MTENLFDLFHSRFPNDGIFLEARDGATILYSEIDEECSRIASFLRSKGVRANDRVVVQVEKSPHAVLLYLACLRAGAIFVPLNTAYTSEELGFLLGDAKPRLFVCDPQRESVLAPIAQSFGVESLLTLGANNNGSFLEYQSATVKVHETTVGGDQLAAILYTSGTTGRPKGAMLSHDNLASNALSLHEIWRWAPRDVLLHALPIFHAHGLFVALHCALLNGSKVIFLDNFDLDTVIEKLPSVTVYMGVPTHYVRLLDHPELSPQTCRNMRLFLSGSAPLRAETHREFKAKTSHRILERYGMTEAGMITSNPYDGERVAGTVGFALPGIDLRVTDQEGKTLRSGETGTLEMRGPNLFKGYWQLPDKTKEEMRDDGFFITGDLAVQDGEGRVTIVGRGKDLIISGGYNVYPREVEQVIDNVDGVSESAVVGVAHPDFGEGVTAVIVRSDPKLDEDLVRTELATKLARFKHPKKIFFIDVLPRNTMGKIQKNLLRERYAAIYS